MSLKNNAILIGNLGGDPVLKKFDSGAKVATFRLATSEKFKKGDEVVEETQWHNIVCWEKHADNAAKYLKKGSKCGVMGMIKNRSYTDNEGNERWVTEINVRDIEFLDQKKSSDNQAPTPTPATAKPSTTSNQNQSTDLPLDLDMGEDDLPF